MRIRSQMSSKNSELMDMKEPCYAILKASMPIKDRMTSRKLKSLMMTNSLLSDLKKAVESWPDTSVVFFVGRRAGKTFLLKCVERNLGLKNFSITTLCGLENCLL